MKCCDMLIITVILVNASINQLQMSLLCILSISSIVRLVIFALHHVLQLHFEPDDTLACDVTSQVNQLM